MGDFFLPLSFESGLRVRVHRVEDPLDGFVPFIMKIFFYVKVFFLVDVGWSPF